MQAELERVGRNGILHLEITYLPFVSPDEQEEAERSLEEKRLKSVMGKELQMTVGSTSQNFSKMRGVLTVTVHRCINLEVRWCSMLDAICKMRLDLN